MRKIMRRSAIAIMAGLFSVGLTAPAVSAEKIRMVAIDGYPAKALWVKEFSSYFIPEVNKRLAAAGNYEIEWQEAYGGTIVKPKGVLEGIKLGLGDIGIVTTVFHNSTIPAQAIAYVTPFISTDARVVAKLVDEVADKFPEMKKAFEAQNQVYLTNAVVLDTYQVFSRDPITGLKDMEGKKVAGAGYNMRYLEGMGATGVRGGLTSFYNMLQTGVVDQAMIWPEAAMTFKINEVAPHMLYANMGTVNSKAVTVNLDVWKKLPDEVKTILQEVAYDYRDHCAELAMERAAASIHAFTKAGGKVYPLSDAERNQWASSMPNIAVEWAAQLKEKGLPGDEMLKYYISRLQDEGQVPARDWSNDLSG